MAKSSNRKFHIFVCALRRIAADCKCVCGGLDPEDCTVPMRDGYHATDCPCVVAQRALDNAANRKPAESSNTLQSRSPATIFEVQGKFGVMQDGAVLYEADFPCAVTQAIIELENSGSPPADWEATRELLLKRGFKVEDVDGKDTVHAGNSAG